MLHHAVCDLKQARSASLVVLLLLLLLGSCDQPQRLACPGHSCLVLQPLGWGELHASMGVLARFYISSSCQLPLYCMISSVHPSFCCKGMLFIGHYFTSYHHGVRATPPRPQLLVYAAASGH